MTPKMIYTGIRVKVMDESINFYTKTLGMTLLDREKTPQTQGEVATLKSPGSEQELEFNWYEKGTNFGTPYINGSEVDHLAFGVESMSEWISELESRGVRVLLRIHEAGGWNEAFIEDPNGIWIEFLQRK